MQLGCCRFRTEKIGSSDLRSCRSKRKRGGNTTPVGNPSRGYNRHATSMRRR